jgi:hypothetical protein
MGENVPPDVNLPALERLELLDEHFSGSDVYTVPTINADFLLNFPNLRDLLLPNINLQDYIKFLINIGPYFAIRNGWKEESLMGRTLTIFAHPQNIEYCTVELAPTPKLASLLQELAVADGRILIEKMPIKLLDEAVRLLKNQPDKLLSSFGKCIRSLVGFSSSLYEVELPNMRNLEVFWESEVTAMNVEIFSRWTVKKWPKLEGITLNKQKAIYGRKQIQKLVFGSEVLRPSVRKLFFYLELLSLSSKKDLKLLGNFSKLIYLEFVARADDVVLFRSLMRVLPTSCPKIQLLFTGADFHLGDEDFLIRVDGKGSKLTTPPLLQFPGKYKGCANS